MHVLSLSTEAADSNKACSQRHLTGAAQAEIQEGQSELNLPQWRPAGTLSASSASKADSSRNATLRPAKEAVLQGDAPMDLFRSSVTCMQAPFHQWFYCSAKMLISHGIMLSYSNKHRPVVHWCH